MLELAQTHTSALSTRRPPAANQSLAKQNRKSSQTTENNRQRTKSIASFCRVFVPPLLFRRNVTRLLLPANSLLPVESSTERVLASGLPQGHARNRRGAAP
jgi:hypothetical protein